MAKVKGMAATNYIGKLGPAIFYMRDGQNINRAVAAQVSNPKTEAQMNQRTKLTNIVRLYQANKAWMEKFAFENKEQKLSVYNAFVQANLANSEVYLTKEESETYKTVFENCLFTDGTLPPVRVLGYSDVYYNTGIKLGDEQAEWFAGTLTVADLTAAILANNPEWDEGDQLSVVVNVASGAGLPNVYYYELMLDSADTTQLADLDIFRVLAADRYAIDGTTQLGLQVSTDDLPHDESGADAMIITHSRKQSGKIQVSRAYMNLNSDAEEILALYTSDSARARARRSYGATREPFLAPGYQTASGGGSTAIEITSVNDHASGELFIAQLDDEVEVVLSQPFTGEITGGSIKFGWGNEYESGQTTANMDSDNFPINVNGNQEFVMADFSSLIPSDATGRTDFNRVLSISLNIGGHTATINFQGA